MTLEDLEENIVNSKWITKKVNQLLKERECNYLKISHKKILRIIIEAFEEEIYDNIIAPELKVKKNGDIKVDFIIPFGTAITIFVKILPMVKIKDINYLFEERLKEYQKMRSEFDSF
jgi:hypothetical protein